MNDRLASIIDYMIYTRAVKSRAEFGKKIGKSSSQITDMIKGIRPITMRTICSICNEFPELNEDWLITGKGNMISNIPDRDDNSNGSAKSNNSTLSIKDDNYDDTADVPDAQKLEELLNFLNLNANQLAKALGFKTPQKFYDIRAGKCGFSKKLASQIKEEFHNVNENYLLAGRGKVGHADNSILILNENSTKHQDNRHYYSDSPDVLRAKIEVLDARIKEKDAQIKEKDAQINKLLDILSQRH